MSAATVRTLGPDDVRALSLPGAVAAIENALRDGFDPAGSPARSVIGLNRGQFFFMPSETADAVGAKVAVVHNKPAPGRPAVSAIYLMFDPSSLAVTTIIDGTALTALRTPAVSIAAIRPALERYAGPVRVVVFGAGVQGRGHVDALRQATAADIAEVSVVVRHPEHARIDLAPGESLCSVEDPRLESRLAQAAIVVCATAAHAPLFDSGLLRDDVSVIAVGSHRADARELDAALMGRAQVVVEDVTTALHESGDVIMARDEGMLAARQLITMRATVRGEHQLDLGRPIVFKGSGMAWQDLVVAQAVLSAQRP